MASHGNKPPKIDNPISNQKSFRNRPRTISQIARRAWAVGCVIDTSPQTINTWRKLDIAKVQQRIERLNRAGFATASEPRDVPWRAAVATRRADDPRSSA